MNLFCFLPRAFRRLKLGALLCAVLVVCSAFASGQTTDNGGGTNPGTTLPGQNPINNPKTGNVNTGNYIPVAPPSGPEIYYNHRWDLYAGAAYTNFLAGPRLIQRSNLGGWDAAASYWLNWHWGIMGDARMYIGTSGVFPNPYNITGPRIMQYYFMAGPEYRVFRRAKASGTFHALFGNAYGIFDAANLHGVPIQDIGLFPTQWTFGSAFGGTFDYNYTPRIAFRIQPEMLMTHYSGTMQQNFAFSVGPIIRLGHLNTGHEPNRPQTEKKHHFHL